MYKMSYKIYKYFNGKIFEYNTKMLNHPPVLEPRVRYILHVSREGFNHFI